MEPLRVNESITLPPDELKAEFVLASGPGGQKVNKTASQVILRFRLAASRALGEREKSRALERLAGRMNREGELIVRSTRHREQRRNLVDARSRLAALIAAAIAPPPPERRATKPTRGSVRRRLSAKRRRSETKRGRKRPDED